jgi:hypothetical protein
MIARKRLSGLAASVIGEPVKDRCRIVWSRATRRRSTNSFTTRGRFSDIGRLA